MPADLPPPLRRRVPLWAGVVIGFGALGAGAVVLPMLRLDPLPRTQSAPDLAAPVLPLESLPGSLPDPHVPRFDLVRTDADGQMIVAGRTAPDVHVTLVVDGVTRAETRSDAAGQFVAFLTLERSDAARVLWLVARDAQGDRLASDDTVILAPDMQSGLPDPGPDLAALGMPPGMAPDGVPTGRPDRADLSDDGRRASSTDRVGGLAMPGSPDVPESPADGHDADPPRGDARSDPDPAPRAVAAVQPLVSDADGVRVMAPAPLAGEALRVDSVAYGAEGAVVLRGRVAPGTPEGVVRATLSGLPPVAVTPDADGTWTLRLIDVAPGDYRLDVARAADADSRGTDTVTLPFRRAAPEDVASALTGEAARIVTVQPGATLWAIARDRYGDGARYVQVYDANREAIFDPDLIYPGQIFHLPAPAPR